MADEEALLAPLASSLPGLGLQQCDSSSDLERQGGVQNVVAIPLI